MTAKSWAGCAQGTGTALKCSKRQSGLRLPLRIRQPERTARYCRELYSTPSVLQDDTDAIDVVIHIAQLKHQCVKCERDRKKPALTSNKACTLFSHLSVSVHRAQDDDSLVINDTLHACCIWRGRALIMAAKRRQKARKSRTTCNPSACE